MSEEVKEIEFEILKNGDIAFRRFHDSEMNEATEEILLAIGVAPKDIGNFFADQKRIIETNLLQGGSLSNESFCG
jgi:hypothetical protein